jgi:MFS transporter, CP family, cyanate transporter
VLIIALLVQGFAPAHPNGTVAVRRRWWPDWGNALIWRLGFMLGTVNAIYFSTNAFIPDFLRAHGKAEWISAALTGLNVAQLPASFVLLAYASRLELKAWPIVGCGMLCVAATFAVVFGSGPVVVAGASVLGFSAAAILVLVLALPPLLAHPDDVHRVTAAMFTISYSCAVIVPIISGVLWDWTGIDRLAFAPIGASGFLLILLASAINHVPRAGS